MSKETLPAVQVEKLVEGAREATSNLPAGALDRILDDQSVVEPTVPFAGLRQKAGPENIAGGLKFNDGRRDMELPCDLVVLAVKKSRVCWDSENLAAPPRCKSVDAITRLDDVPNPGLRPDKASTTECAECVRRLWPRERLELAERLKADWIVPPLDCAEKPECREVLNLLVCLPDGSDSFILSVHGMSLRATNNYLGRFNRRSLPFFTLVSKLSSEYRETAKGDYYVVSFEEIAETPREFISALWGKYPDYMRILTRGTERFDEAMDREWGEGNGENDLPQNSPSSE